MKKLKYVLFVMLLFLLNINGVNATNKLKDISIDIVLDTNGNAHVTEIWDMKTSKDTELYKIMNNLGNMEVSNFKVSMDNTNFTYDNNWNIEGSFNDKKYKNGINYTDEGIELCFGISNYGSYKYTLTYDISNFVFKTDDADVIYFKMFSGMDMGPDTFKVVVKGPTAFLDTLDVWGYGYKGYAYVYDGLIMMSNEENTNLSSTDNVVLLVKFDPNTFTLNSDNTYNQFKTFNDVKNMSDEGTYNYDYNSSSFEEIIDTIIGIVSSLIPVIIFFVVFIVAKNSSNYKFESLGRKIDMQNINNFRDIPCNKDIYKGYFLAQAYKLNSNNTDFLGSVFLKWLFENKIQIEKQSKKKLFGTKEEQVIILKSDLVLDTEIEQKMYDILVEASKDFVLEENELSAWSKKHYSKLFNWFKDAEKYGLKEYEKSNLVYKVNSYDSKYTIKDGLKEEAIKLAGLKKYLLEFSRIKEKTALEVKLWKEYLMFAQIFGIADKVAEQFKNLYPEVLEEANLNSDLDITDIMILNHLSYMTVASAVSARSAAESYSSGGGGFSVGGGGGGSFGGGGGGSR